MIQCSPISLLGADLIFANNFFLVEALCKIDKIHILEHELKNSFDTCKIEKFSVFSTV